VTPKKAIRLGFRRFLVLLLISSALVWLVSEVTFQLQKGENDRAPQVHELVIPNGTAAEVSTGQKVPEIPDEMVFVVGDVLVVHNEDVADHQLGPLWIPAGTSASLLMEKAERTAYSCSFQNTKYLGLFVQEATTIGTRLSALALAAPATAMFLFVYSLIIWPLDGPEKKNKLVSTSSSGGIGANP
jgi:hypothetical protein